MDNSVHMVTTTKRDVKYKIRATKLVNGAYTYVYHSHDRFAGLNTWVAEELAKTFTNSSAAIATLTSLRSEARRNESNDCLTDLQIVVVEVIVTTNTMYYSEDDPRLHSILRANVLEKLSPFERKILGLG